MVDLRAWLRGLFGPRAEEAPYPGPAGAPAELEPPGTFAEGHNAFALALYGRLCRRPGNLFISPFSIRTALAMTYAGAGGETAEQMGRALRFNSPGEALHAAFAEVIRRLNAAGGGEYEMAVANALWAQEGAPPLSDFLERVAAHYGGGLNVVDFRRDAEGARALINLWVEERTRQRIAGLLPQGGLGGDTRLVLVNAVYFKGLWRLPFRESATRPEPFYLEDGGEVRAPLMRQREAVRYMAAADFQAAELDYRGGDLSMLLLLPNRKDGLRDLEKGLSARMLRECVAQMSVREVELLLPRFKVTWGTEEIGSHLRALGMTLAFERSRADFSGINGLEPSHAESLFISAIFHKTFVEVNEQGTEAAAATAVVMDVRSAMPNHNPPPVPVFRADHPFLFAIRELKSDTLLFLGRVADPTRES